MRRAYCTHRAAPRVFRSTSRKLQRDAGGCLTLFWRTVRSCKRSQRERDSTRFHRVFCDTRARVLSNLRTSRNRVITLTLNWQLVILIRDQRKSSSFLTKESGEDGNGCTEWRETRYPFVGTQFFFFLSLTRNTRVDIAIVHGAANGSGWKGEKIAIYLPLYDSGYIASLYHAVLHALRTHTARAM